MYLINGNMLPLNRAGAFTVIGRNKLGD
ncbi:portal protein [Gardnerella phage vB_Gva_AB1]|nr:portal protein [Gardnerella phage vB_Gva_AB1]